MKSNKQDRFLMSLVGELNGCDLRSFVVVLENSLISPANKFLEFFCSDYELIRLQKYQEYYDESMNIWSFLDNGLSVHKLLNNNIKNRKLIIIDIDTLFYYYLDNLHNYFSISLDQEIDISKIRTNLIKIGYVFVDIVDYCGQFSIKGDVLDIGIVSNKKLCGVRININYDKVASINYFDFLSQRRFGVQLQDIIIAPSTKVTLSDINSREFSHNYNNYFSTSDNDFLVEAINNGRPVIDFDHFGVFIYPKKTFFELIDNDFIFILPNNLDELLTQRAVAIDNEYNIASSYRKVLRPNDAYVDYTMIRDNLLDVDKIIY